VSRIKRFFLDSWQELKKVNWPTPQQARNLTILVIGVSAFVGAFIAFFDTVFTILAKSINAG
jgi:preprotein translocase SecE subunit